MQALKHKSLLVLMTLVWGLSLFACNRGVGYAFDLEETTIVYQDSQDEWHPLIDASLLKGVDDISLLTIETDDGVLYWRYDGSDRNKLIDSKALRMLEDGRFRDEDVLLRANVGVYEWREVDEEVWQFLFDPHQIDASNLVPEDFSGGLPARVPLLEHFNLMDGTRYVEDEPVNFDWYDEQSGLYLPDMDESKLDRIVISTLENTVTACVDFHEDCKGGVFEAQLSSGDKLEFLLDKRIAFDETAFATIDIDVASLSAGATLEVVIIQGGMLLDIGSIDTTGIHSFVVETEFGGKLSMILKGENEARVDLASVMISDEDGKIMNESRGATFEDWKLKSENGTLRRKDAAFTVASYRYNPYGESTLYAPYGLTPNGVPRYGGEAINEVIISEDVTVIPSHAFNCLYRIDCFEALKRVVLPEGITTIKYSAFAHTPALRNVNLPDSLEMLDQSAFQSSSIETITLPQGIKTIHSFTFASTNLKRIEIPPSVESIDMSAFSTTSPLEEIVFTRLHTDGFVEFLLFGAPSNRDLSEIFYIDESTKIFVPDESLDAYKAQYPDYAALIFPFSDK